MSSTITKLRAALTLSRPSHNSAGYPPELRSRATSWMLERRAVGDDWTTLGRELGISRKTAQSWVEQADLREEGPASFLPVRLSESAAPNPTPLPLNPAANLAASSPGPVLITPRGYRVEGLDADLLVTVLERVG